MLKQAKPSGMCTKLSKTKPITLRLREKHKEDSLAYFGQDDMLKSSKVDAATGPQMNQDYQLST